jgi:hypothetical protein
MKTLVIPPAAQRDPNSIQMISGWIAEKGLHCTLNVARVPLPTIAVGANNSFKPKPLRGSA